jgi:signal transduction histidine kinase
MEKQRLLQKGFPVVLVTVLLATALIAFIIKYNSPAVEIPRLLTTGDVENKLIFDLNFYISFILFCVSVYGCFFFCEQQLKYFFLIIGFAAVSLSVYILDDLFTINLLVYTTYIVTVLFCLSRPANIISAATAIFLFLVLESHPSFMGVVLIKNSQYRPSSIISFLALLVFISVETIVTRELLEKNLIDRETIKHLEIVGKKMVLFNHRLQELAKLRGEDAVKQDRLRFTRDLHDSCGYAFTNIIMTSDAAVSQGRIDPSHSQEILQRIRTLASDGLNETRETLHLIRRIQEPYTKSIETVHQLKSIFEEVTGIKVDVEWGNMHNEYGPTVNKVIVRIIQEAFTNAIRHGMATYIVIQFWEFPEQLSMTVTDNGIGAAAIVKGIGLAGMEERLGTLGGNLAVSLPQGGGFRLRITIPIVERKI